MRKQRIDQSIKRHAIILYLTGFRIAKIEKLLGVRQPTVFKWVKEFGPKFELMRAEESPSVITMRTKAEHEVRILDEDWVLIYRDGKIEIRKKDK
jgi:transposase-like protein